MELAEPRTGYEGYLFVKKTGWAKKERGITATANPGGRNGTDPQKFSPRRRLPALSERTDLLSLDERKRAARNGYQGASFRQKKSTNLKRPKTLLL